MTNRDHCIAADARHLSNRDHSVGTFDISLFACWFQPAQTSTSTNQRTGPLFETTFLECLVVRTCRGSLEIVESGAIYNWPPGRFAFLATETLFVHACNITCIEMPRVCVCPWVCMLLFSLYLNDFLVTSRSSSQCIWDSLAFG